MSNTLAICKELVVDSARYWERMRIAYNLVLATLSLVCWGPEIFSGRAIDLISGVVVLLVFAVVANLCYCSAYPIDLLFQLTPARSYRKYCRWVLFTCGMLLASVSALWVLLGDHMA